MALIYTATEAGFGVNVEPVGGMVQITARTPFGSKALHFDITKARMLADAIGFAVNDAERQQAERRLRGQG